MAKIVIIGGGFAGLAAAQKLARCGGGLAITLIDKKETSDFLPALPDIIGRGIHPSFLQYAIAKVSVRHHFRFENAEVNSLDVEKKEVATSKGIYSYDYAIIASGSETNFYGNALIEYFAHKLDDAQDAQAIAEKVKHKEYDTYIVGGGGYTGIEVATNLHVLLKQLKKDAQVLIVERAPSILGPLPEWMKAYVRKNLAELGIEITLNSTIESITGDRVALSGERIFKNAMVIWVAGVKTPAFIQNLKCEKNPQGRLKVDEYLRINESCFAAGDAAYVAYSGNYLRMAVQFAITQGECAAENSIRTIRTKPLKAYRPFDFGYIIPMANNRSCGNILKQDMRGGVPTFLHFFMCVARSIGMRNRCGIIKDLVMAPRL